MSNFLKLKDARMGTGDASISLRPVQPAEIEKAVGLILSSEADGGAALDQAVGEFMGFARSRAMDLHLFWVAEQSGKLISAILPVVSPGRTMLLLAPLAIPSALAGSHDVLVALVERVCQSGYERGVHLAQALVEPQHEFLKALYLKAGFSVVAELLYLHAMVKSDLEPVKFPEEYTCETYSPGTHESFARTILDSYEQSMDCPKLNGLRSIDDIISGHQSAGDFDPKLWFLLSESIPAGEGTNARGRALAVLLLSTSARTDAMELVYLGLTPAARGRKINPRLKVSELLMRHALACAAGRKLAHFSCAVDAANVPALKLYYRLGMQRTAVREAVLRDLRLTPPSAGARSNSAT